MDRRLRGYQTDLAATCSLRQSRWLVGAVGGIASFRPPVSRP
jgi:hypothetical protein